MIYYIYEGNPNTYDRDNDYDFIIKIDSNNKNECEYIKPEDIPVNTKIHTFPNPVINIENMLDHLDEAIIYSREDFFLKLKTEQNQSE